MQLSVTFPDIKCYAPLVQKILIGINISLVTSMIDGVGRLETPSHTVKRRSLSDQFRSRPDTLS